MHSVPGAFKPTHAGIAVLLRKIWHSPVPQLASALTWQRTVHFVEQGLTYLRVGLRCRNRRLNVSQGVSRRLIQ